MSNNLDVSLSIKLKQTDAKARIAEIGKEFEKLGKSTLAPAQEIAKLQQKLQTLRSTAKLDVARDIIGVQPFKNIQREIDRTNAAFARLKASGQLSAAELGQAFLKTKDRIEDLKGGMNGIGSYFDKIKGSVLELAGLFAVFVLAAKGAITFEDALVDLQRAANISREEAEDMGKEFKDLAEELGQSATAIANMATAAAKAGVAKGDLLEFARIVATAAMNFDMIPEQAGDALAKLKNILGLSISELEAFVATVNELADNAAASEADIIEALKGGGGSAMLFGLDPKQAAALATGFLNVGASAEQAGTAMRTLLGRLRLAASGGKGASALAGVVGDAKEFSRVLAGDANGALNIFLSSLSKLSVSARSGVLRDIFQEGLDTDNIAKLTNDLDKFADVSAHAAKSDDELVKSLRDLTALKLSSTRSELNLLATSWRNAGSALGELFLPVIRAASIALAAVAQAIRYLAETAPKLTILISLLGTLALAWRTFTAIGTVAVAVLGKLGFSIGATATAGGLLAGFGARVVAVFGSIASAAATVWTAFRAGSGVLATVRVAMGGLMGPVGWIVTGLTLLAAAWDLFSGSGKSGEAAIEARRKSFDGVSEALTNVGAAATQAKDQIATAMQSAVAPVEALTADYKLATEQIKTSLDQRLIAIDDAAKRETQAAQTSSLSQRALITETARIALEAERQKVAAVSEIGSQMEDVWERTYGAALQIEREAGITGSQLAKEANDAKLAIYKQLEGSYRRTIDVLIGEEQRHLQVVKDIENQRLMLKMSVEDRIRGLKQKTLSEEQAYADRVKQIDEKLALARAASANGQSELVKKYAEEGLALAASNANAVTRTVEQNGQRVTNTVVSLEQAVATSTSQMQELYKVQDADLAKTGQNAATMAKDVGAQAAMVDAKLQDLLTAIGKIQAQQAVEIEAKLTADEQSATEAIAKLKALADAQAVMVKMDADLQAANATLAAWKADPDNSTVAVSAIVAQESLAATAASLKAAMVAADLQVPAGLDYTPALEKLETLVDTLNETRTESEHAVDPDLKEVNAALRRLNDTVTHSIHYIHEVTVSGNATGGPIGRHAKGGLIQRLADGGRAWRRIVGQVRGAGTATSDSIRAMLSNGEFVLRERATSLASKFLPGFVEGLNAVSSRADLQRLLENFAASMAMPAIHLAGGGPVSMSSSPAIAALPGGFGKTVTWLIRAGESEASVRVASDSEGELERMTKELNRLNLLQG